VWCCSGDVIDVDNADEVVADEGARGGNCASTFISADVVSAVGCCADCVEFAEVLTCGGVKTTDMDFVLE
jgi:hypothetical protein